MPGGREEAALAARSIQLSEGRRVQNVKLYTVESGAATTKSNGYMYSLMGRGTRRTISKKRGIIIMILL